MPRFIALSAGAGLSSETSQLLPIALVSSSIRGTASPESTPAGQMLALPGKEEMRRFIEAQVAAELAGSSFHDLGAEAA